MSNLSKPQLELVSSVTTKLLKQLNDFSQKNSGKIGTDDCMNIMGYGLAGAVMNFFGQSIVPGHCVEAFDEWTRITRENLLLNLEKSKPENLN